MTIRAERERQRDVGVDSAQLHDLDVTGAAITATAGAAGKPAVAAPSSSPRSSPRSPSELSSRRTL